MVLRGLVDILAKRRGLIWKSSLAVVAVIWFGAALAGFGARAVGGQDAGLSGVLALYVVGSTLIFSLTGVYVRLATADDPRLRRADLLEAARAAAPLALALAVPTSFILLVGASVLERLPVDLGLASVLLVAALTVGWVPLASIVLLGAGISAAGGPRGVAALEAALRLVSGNWTLVIATMGLATLLAAGFAVGPALLIDVLRVGGHVSTGPQFAIGLLRQVVELVLAVIVIQPAIPLTAAVLFESLRRRRS